MANTASKVKKIVSKKSTKKCECKELERIDYVRQEEITDKAKTKILDNLADVYGLQELATTRTGIFDTDIVAGIIDRNVGLFNQDIVEQAKGPIGAFHAKIEQIAIARSTTERKGVRATLIVRVERYYDYENTSGKESWREYHDVYPCDCVSELVGDIVHEVSEAIVGRYNKVVADYNDKLECKGKCGDCKCGK